MKVALVSAIYNHGKILAEIGTPLLLAFEEMSEVDPFDVYTQIENEGNLFVTNKAKIIPIMDLQRPLTYLKLLRMIARSKYDRIIVNSMPTSQGNKNLPNILYLILPIIWSRIYGLKVSVLYHNSPFLNEVEKLGYSGLKNRFKSWIIKTIEKRMYSSCDVYFLLKLYAERIKEIIPNARVNCINGGGITGFATLYLNKKLVSESVVKIPSEKSPTVLMYGSWGPQKDIRSALQAAKMVKDSGSMIKTVVAGDVNIHFSNYAGTFEGIISEYKEVIDKRIGYVHEADVYSIFMEADTIVLPYVVPGGFSGVLSISTLFRLNIIVPEFDEFKEQSYGYDQVHFVPKNFKPDDVVLSIENILSKIKPGAERIMEPALNFKKFINEIRNSRILG